ncbi:MAG: pentapeptide repeat-containing protein [Actinobacteria bacterium]|nr:pentapeptide repeat-containing protein [Actinomycetota bacterium]
MRDVLLAIGIGGLLLAGQWMIDDRRSDRETHAATELALQSERLEDLRFVRDKSGPERVVRPFSGVDLSKQTLDGLELAGADFRGAHLLGTSLVGTDLTGARFAGASLTGANLSSAVLANADLSCDLSERLNCVSLSDARLFETDLTAANLAGARMTGVWLTAKVRLDGADLSRVRLYGAQLFGVDFSRAILDEADLRGACWSDETRWPSGFTPPENSAAETCH